MTRLRRPAAEPDDTSPFAGMLAALHVQPFDGNLRTLVLLGAVLAVAFLVRELDSVLRLGAGAVLTVAVTLIVAFACRHRWRAEDAIAWHSSERDLQWVARTGAHAPLEPAEAEVWLGTHPAGSVPDYERALAAQRAGDPRADRMVAALPSTTPAERVDKAWAYFVGGAPVHGTGPLAAGLPPADRTRRVAVSIMVAGESFTAGAGTRGAGAWIATLLQARSFAGRPRLGRNRSIRYWAYRLRSPIGVAVEFALVTFLVLPMVPGPRVDAGTMGTRGAPAPDSAKLYAAIPAIRRALESASPYPEAYTPRLAEQILSGGLPSVIWEPVDVQPNLPGAAGRRVSAAELFIGLDPPVALVTFAGDSHPSAAYTVDPALRPLLLEAVSTGPPPKTSPPSP